MAQALTRVRTGPSATHDDTGLADILRKLVAQHGLPASAASAGAHHGGHRAAWDRWRGHSEGRQHSSVSWTQQEPNRSQQ